LTEPPRWAEFLLYIFLRKEDREKAVDDLNEEFPEVVEHFGVRAARAWYWSQVLRSVWPLIGDKVSRFFGWFLKLGILGWLWRQVGNWAGELIRRGIGH
jgi:hypothetical protein